MLKRVGTELQRYYYAVEKRLDKRIFARQADALYGRLSYLDVLAHLHQTRRFKRYLEIGVATGQSLALSRSAMNVGVDPAFEICYPLDGRFAIHRTTSDQFFESYAGDPFDFIFVDGLHIADQVARDLTNALRHLRDGGLIAVHDTAPFNPIVASPTRWSAIWTGDVYRAVVPYARRFQADVMTLLVPPTGLTLIRGSAGPLSASSDILAPSTESLEACLDALKDHSRTIDDVEALRPVLAEFYPHAE